MSHRPVRGSRVFAPGLSSCETVCRQPLSSQIAESAANIDFKVAPKNTGRKYAADRLFSFEHERQKSSGRYRTQRYFSPEIIGTFSTVAMRGEGCAACVHANL